MEVVCVLRLIISEDVISVMCLLDFVSWFEVVISFSLIDIVFFAFCCMFFSFYFYFIFFKWYRLVGKGNDSKIAKNDFALKVICFFAVMDVARTRSSFLISFFPIFIHFSTYFSFRRFFEYAKCIYRVTPLNAIMISGCKSWSILTLSDQTC